MSTRRKLLLGILVGAIVGNIAFFLLPQRKETPLFVLEPLNASGTLSGFRPDEPLPIFDGKSWSIEGEAVVRPSDHLLDTTKWQGPHTVGKIMLVELRGDEDSEAFRRMIGSLADDGICRIAVFQAAAPVAEQGLATAVRVRSFLDADSRTQKCIDRVNGET